MLANSASPWMFALVIVLFSVTFPVFWGGICWLIALTGGWRALAAAYAVKSPLGTQILSGQYVVLRLLASYNGTVSFWVDPKGLTISVMFLFRLGHPPLFIPWSDVSVREQGGMYRAFQMKELRFRKVPTVPLRLTESAFEAIREAAGANLR